MPHEFPPPGQPFSAAGPWDKLSHIPPKSPVIKPKPASPPSNWFHLQLDSHGTVPATAPPPFLTHVRNRHCQQHARHGRNQAKASHYRRRFPHFLSQINLGTTLRPTAIQTATLQAAGAPQGGRKTTERPESPLPTTRTPRKKPSQSKPPPASVATFSASNQSWYCP